MFGEEIRKNLLPDPAIIDLVAQVTQHPDRPYPIRAVDQIYMLPGSQAVQALLTIDYLKYRDVVFVGDGDCMAIVIAHLANKGVFKGPAKIRILDFDERLISFFNQVVKDLGLPADLIHSRLYNVKDPIPEDLAQAHDTFYTNPPYGSADQGECGKIFLARCMELCKPAPSWGIALLPFAHKEDWSRVAMANIQSFLCESGYVVSEMIREIHQYHLDDRPSLRSCNVVLDRVYNKKTKYAGQTLSDESLLNFYGSNTTVIPSYINKNGNFILKDGKEGLVGDQPKWRN
jgi:N4-bis(aminopropyl)spermidine synthase